jgi:hypothetical protein
MIGLGRKMPCDAFYIFPQIAPLPCPLTYPLQLPSLASQSLGSLFHGKSSFPAKYITFDRSTRMFTDYLVVAVNLVRA